MNRLLFEKRGDAVYLSHLDLMRVFQRAFKRAGILIWHSQGFSPRAYVSIALPLPVGMESRCEILDFEIEDGSVELSGLPARLNAVLPAGIRESIVITKHSKKGDKELDIKPLIFALSIAAVSETELRLACILSAQNPGLNPQLLAAAIETHLPDYKPDFARAGRIEALDEQENPFR